MLTNRLLICVANVSKPKISVRYATSIVNDKSETAVVKTPPPKASGHLASHKRGTGGRSSFSGNIVTVFGASGLVGSDLVNRLGKDGSQIIIPYRGVPYDAKHLRPFADLGQLLFFPFHLEDEESILKAVKHSNIVINLIGSDFETPKFSFDAVHNQGARRLARICRQAGVERFIHVSALNCTPDPHENLIPGGSDFLRSKYWGEVAVREEFPDAVIVRPAEIFNEMPCKLLYNYLSALRHHSNNKINLYQRGEHTYKMPVFAGDFLDGLFRILRDPTMNGQTYEFVGPYAYKLSDMVDWMYRKIHRGELHYYQRWNYGGYFASVVNYFEIRKWIFRRWPYVSWDQLEWKECTSDVLTGVPTLEDLGVTDLTVFELRMSDALRLWDRLAYIGMKKGEYPEPPPPRHYPRLREHPGPHPHDHIAEELETNERTPLSFA